MALKQKVAAASLGWLRALAVEHNVVWIFTTPESIYAAELAGLPPVIEERHVPPDEIEALAIRAADGGVVPASNVAHWVKQIVRDGGGAERLGAKARRVRDPGAQRAHQQVVEQVLRGDLLAIPPDQLPAARAMVAQMDAMLATAGLERSTVIEAMKRARIGLGWTVQFAKARLPRRDANGWLHDDARAAPATVLRAGMHRQRDNNTSRHEKDKVDSDFEYDVRHIAYAAYSDVATIDAENFDATKGARRLLDRPAFHGTGKLRDVLQDIEAALAAPPS